MMSLRLFIFIFVAECAFGDVMHTTPIFDFNETTTIESIEETITIPNENITTSVTTLIDSTESNVIIKDNLTYFNETTTIESIKETTTIPNENITTSVTTFIDSTESNVIVKDNVTYTPKMDISHINITRQYSDHNSASTLTQIALAHLTMILTTILITV